MPGSSTAFGSGNQNSDSSVVGWYFDRSLTPAWSRTSSSVSNWPVVSVGERPINSTAASANKLAWSPRGSPSRVVRPPNVSRGEAGQRAMIAMFSFLTSPATIPTSSAAAFFARR